MASGTRIPPSRHSLTRRSTSRRRARYLVRKAKVVFSGPGLKRRTRIFNSVLPVLPQDRSRVRQREPDRPGRADRHLRAPEPSGHVPLREPDDSSGLPAQRLRYVDQPERERGWRRTCRHLERHGDARRHDCALVGASRTCRSGRCGRSSPTSTNPAPALAGSCSMTSAPTIVRARRSSTTRSYRTRRRSAIRIRPRTLPGTASGPRCTRWATR